MLASWIVVHIIWGRGMCVWLTDQYVVRVDVLDDSSWLESDDEWGTGIRVVPGNQSRSRRHLQL